ncbi:MAG: SLBB domain-containing protein, partial [Odoribacter sp.]|nr:SLBB domain-containing protein [Odoribacter sp.]
MKKVFLLVLLLYGTVVGALAQMTDEQVILWVQNAQKQGMGQQEMVISLMQRGVTQQQLMRLKDLYTKNLDKKTGEYTPTGTDDRMRTPLEKPEKSTDWSLDNMQVKKTPNGMEEMREPLNGDITLLKEYTLFDSLSDGMVFYQQPEKKEDKVFGRNIFNNELLTFEPNINIATPANYVLGPGDEVIIDIWGDSEQTIRQRISPDGTITVAKLGPVFLNGLTIREANSRLKSTFSKIYSSMGGANPTTYINLSLGEIRSISVNVVGEVQMPGTYTLPSLASLFHALYSAGGVNDIGSLRSVKVSRAGELLADVDIYQYLLKGKSDMDIRLEDGDVILVAPYQNLVTLKGKVKRPLIYEMKDDETVGDLLDYAGGFTGDAYKKAVRIIRKSGREYQVYNVDKDDFATFPLTDKDEVGVDSVLDRFENKVEIRGAVYRAGLYAVSEDVSTVRQLIEKAEGLRGDAFLNRAVLYRERPDLTLEALSVDVIGILNGKTEDIALAKNDVLYIPAITDLQEDYTVTIYGEVGVPETYKYVSDMTVEDLI